jgi:hypothetical protein
MNATLKWWIQTAIKVLPFKEKKEWNLSAKYNIGKKVTKEDSDNAYTEV